MPAVLRVKEFQISRVLLSKRFFVMVLLFVAALGIRLYHVNEPPLNFHATRQYRSLLIARGFYYESAPSIPEWKKEVARLNRQRQGILEPPVMEFLAVIGYRLAGAERYWIPRLLSSLFWLMGGGFLYFIGKRVTDADAALFATAFYLFLPFAVIASRGFQPDPLMIMLLLASLLAILRYYERPSQLRLALAVAISASALFIKPVSLFVVLAVFVSLALWKHGARRAVVNRDLLLFLLLSLLPTVSFYVYGLFVAGFLRQQAQASFLPQLLFDPFFWRGWLNNIYLVVSLTAFIAALLGTLMLRPGLPRFFVIGMWVGYSLFCLTFNYHIATHDYYHLQLIPIVALAIGPVVALIARRVLETEGTWPGLRIAVWTIGLLALLLSLATAKSGIDDTDFNSKVRLAEAVGQRVRHSTNTLFLSADYGFSLEYHGELSGQPWPLVSDLEWERLAGLPVLDAEARFNAWFARDSPDYFIVLDLREYEQQSDLKEFLTVNYPLAVQNDDYMIFNLQPP